MIAVLLTACMLLSGVSLAEAANMDTQAPMEGFTTYAHGGRVTLIGCPKLDPVNYAVKLSQILRDNDVRSVTVTRMTVPCCGGLSHAVRTAIDLCGKEIPLRIVTISPDGRIMD